MRFWNFFLLNHKKKILGGWILEVRPLKKTFCYVGYWGQGDKEKYLLIQFLSGRAYSFSSFRTKSIFYPSIDKVVFPFFFFPFLFYTFLMIPFLLDFPLDYFLINFKRYSFLFSF